MVTKRKTSVVKKKSVTYVALVLDSSGSMDWLEAEVYKYYKQFIKDLKETSVSNNQETHLSIYSFSNTVDKIRDMSPLEMDSNIHFVADGGTALLDALGTAVGDLDALPSGKNIGKLLVLLSDGLENVSRRWDADSIRKLMLAKLKQGDFTIAVQAPATGKAYLMKYGVLDDCIKTWDISKEGMTAAQHHNTTALSGYMQTRNLGFQSVSNFYKVDIDLGSVKIADIKRSCDDVTNNFKELKVEKEVEVKPFYEAKTGRAYSAGDVFYELTKKEKNIQDYKNICLQEKNDIDDKTKKPIWGGDGIRQILGLPTTGNATVNPKNLKNFHVFVESASDNRKLVRGSKVLFRR